MSLLSLLPACLSLELTDFPSVQDSLPRRPREDLPVSAPTKGEIRGMCHTARPSFHTNARDPGSGPRAMDARDPGSGPHARIASSNPKLRIFVFQNM